MPIAGRNEDSITKRQLKANAQSISNHQKSNAKTPTSESYWDEFELPYKPGRQRHFGNDGDRRQHRHPRRQATNTIPTTLTAKTPNPPKSVAPAAMIINGRARMAAAPD